MEQLNPYLKDVMSFVEKAVAPQPAKYDEIEVTIDVKAKGFAVYVDELYANMQMAVTIKGGTLPITKELFIAYCETLVKSRIDYVTRGRGSKTWATFGPTDRIVVPSYLSLLLSNIGIARHIDYGIELLPVFKGGECLKSDEVRRVSNQLKILKGIGFEYAEGYTRDQDGSLEFMTFALIEGMVYSISKDRHPVYALLASTLGVRGIETVLSPRISYGSEDHLTGLVRALANLKAA